MVEFGFMQHGFAKLSKGPDAFALILQAMHVPSRHLMAWLVILTEFLGGFAVLAGAFCRSGKCSDDCGLAGGVHRRSSSVGLQLDQAASSRAKWRGLRAS